MANSSSNESFDPTFDPTPILRYLSLPKDYVPSPAEQPLEFLKAHLVQLPPQLLQPFSLLLTPRQRTTLMRIKNRRSTFVQSPEGLEKLGWQEARKENPVAYETFMIDLVGVTGRPLIDVEGEVDKQREARKGELEGIEESDWVQSNFMGGATAFHRHVGEGKFERLMAVFEEERQAVYQREQQQKVRQHQEQIEGSVYPEEEGSESEESEVETEKMSSDDARRMFERITRENFIDGHLEWMDYNLVDYDDRWDSDLQDEEERWFDEEEES
ncbi:hypothetical protein FRC02_006282 [Tulasnella sp. 418]|nr:hypothetical protein FRC02_006282 [Tulasnella sp. 418]